MARTPYLDASIGVSITDPAAGHVLQLGGFDDAGSPVYGHAPAPPPVRTLHVYGDSYVNGVGATLGTSDFGTVLGRLLGATDVHIVGVNGAQAADDGLATFLQGFVPSRSAAPYLPASQIVVLKYGTNDVNAGTSVATFKTAMRALAARAGASRVLPASTDGATFNAALTSNFGLGGPVAAGQGSSSPYVAYVNGVPQWFEWEVPSDFEGGAVAARVLSMADDASAIDWTVDGGPPVRQTFAGLHKPGKFNSYVQLFTGLSAGGHALRAQPVNSNSFYADSLEILADPRPLVVLPTIPITPYMDATLARAMNVAIREVAAEFGAIAPELEDLFVAHPEYVLAADNLHPNERGHRLGYAAALYDAIRPSWRSSTLAAAGA